MNEIVVGIDGSEPALHALEWAMFEARSQGASVRLIGVYQPYVYANGMGGMYVDPVVPTQLREQCEEHLAAAEAAAGRIDSEIKVRSEALEGNAAHELVHACDPDDLLVVGSRGETGFWNDLLGSVATAVAHRATCPVMVVPPGAAPPDRSGVGTITVGMDGSTCSARAVAWAYSAARRHGAALHVVHAWHHHPMSPRSGSFDARAELRASGQETLDATEGELASLPDFMPDLVEVHTELVDQSPADSLLSLPAPRMVVVGSHGRGGVRAALLGSVGRTVVEYATAWPVVVVRGAAT